MMLTHRLSCYETNSTEWPLFLKGKSQGNLELLMPLIERCSDRLSQELCSITQHLVSSNHAKIYLCPIPARRKRLIERGYSPQHLLAEYISQCLGHPFRYDPRRIKRIKQTTPQTGLTRSQRLKGQINSLRYVGEPNDQVILVDDVITSGSTLNEAERALKELGIIPLVSLSLFLTDQQINTELPIDPLFKELV
jgi:predicted amidophosphoribosyltransferase